MQQCPVCVEDRTNDHFVDCPQCPYRACRLCVKAYLLQSHLDAHCMSCRNAWPRSVLTRSFTKSFVTGEWKTHRADVLWERERSLFPDTMPLIEEDRRRIGVRNEVRVLDERIAHLQNDLRRKRRELYTNAARKAKEQNQYVRPCIYEECKGFLNERTGECGLCRRRVCLECNVAREEDGHECTEENVTNWRHIRESTKPCPGCHVRIHRVSGCRQMWCPQCHCAFDYATGRIETGIIHNPHYFQYLNRTGAQAQAQAQQAQTQQGGCEANQRGLPLLHHFQRLVSKRSNRETWYDMYRALVHTRQVEVPKYRDASTVPFETLTLDLRKQYMSNEICEARFKKRVQEREKKWLKEKEVYVTLDTLLVLGTELIRSLHADAGEEVWTQREEQRESLRLMFNERIQEINFEFQSRLLVLSENFMFVRV